MIDLSELHTPSTAVREGLGGEQEKFQTGIYDIGVAASRQAGSLVNDDTLKRNQKINIATPEGKPLVNIGPIQTSAISDDIRADPVKADCYWQIGVSDPIKTPDAKIDTGNKSEITRRMIWDDEHSEEVFLTYLPSPNSDIIQGLKWIHGKGRDSKQFILSTTPKGVEMKLGGTAIGSLIGSLPGEIKLNGIEVVYNGRGELEKVIVKKDGGEGESVELLLAGGHSVRVGRYSLEDAEDTKSLLPRKVLKVGEAQIELTTIPSHINLPQLILTDGRTLADSLYEVMKDMPDVRERFFTEPKLGIRYAYQRRIDEATETRGNFAHNHPDWWEEWQKMAPSSLENIGLQEAVEFLERRTSEDQKNYDFQALAVFMDQAYILAKKDREGSFGKTNGAEVTPMLDSTGAFIQVLSSIPRDVYQNAGLSEAEFYQGLLGMTQIGYCGSELRGEIADEGKAQLVQEAKRRFHDEFGREGDIFHRHDGVYNNENLESPSYRTLQFIVANRDNPIYGRIIRSIEDLYFSAYDFGLKWGEYAGRKKWSGDTSGAFESLSVALATARKMIADYKESTMMSLSPADSKNFTLREFARTLMGVISQGSALGVHEQIGFKQVVGKFKN